MSLFNTIIEFEGGVVDVQPRYWAAHRAAMTALKMSGPTQSEWWRLTRLNSPDSLYAPAARGPLLAEYIRVRNEHRDSTEAMQMDEAPPGTEGSLRMLKQMGPCHLATLCSNRDGINATLDRLSVWMNFDQKKVLPEHRERRVVAIRELMGSMRTLMVVGTVPMAYAAGEAGCLTVGLRNGPTFPKLLQQVGVDVFYDSLDQLTDAIANRDEGLRRIGLI